MTPERPRATKGLAICINNLQPSFKPGNTIIGHVFRQVPVLVGAESVTVTIQLIGQAKTEITEWSDHTGESQRTSTSCFNLIFPDGTTVQTLHRGPLHIPRTVPGLPDDEIEPQSVDEQNIGQSWPFSIIIPSQALAVSGHSLGTAVRSDNEAYQQYGSILNKDSGVGSHPLPSSLHIQRRECGPGEFLSGYIEYFLEARLASAHSNNTPRAVAPITIHNPPQSYLDTS
ncbi:hypothetical protein ZTR_06618 [Talaromyces verruculosus]|nr:hypothetical protein ZTR_06618 [Talaromyces verruculosus]